MPSSAFSSAPSQAPSPLTPLNIALFDACLQGACRLADSLDRSLAASTRGVRVVALDAVAPSLFTSNFDAIFLRGLQLSGSAEFSRQTADESIRAALHRSETAYQVIYGSDEESLAQLLRAIGNLAQPTGIEAVPDSEKVRSPGGTPPWVWLCDKCSDPQCEHRLLTDLIDQRRRRPAV